MARRLLSKHSVRDTLDAIVGLAVEMVDGCDQAGITMTRRGTRVETAAATSAVVRRSDMLQHDLHEGPCYDAVSEDHTFTVEDVARETRWPHWSPRAAALGIGSEWRFSCPPRRT